MRARFIVRGGAKWSIGSGASIPILNEPWLPNGECIRSDIPGANFVTNFNINSLMSLHDKSWNEHTVRQVFSVDLANKILHTPQILDYLCTPSNSSPKSSMLRLVNESPSTSRKVRKTPKTFGGGMRLFTSVWNLD